ncbi:MAG TPA: hypothetical protein VFT50_00815 [Baekduia sp.]|nr:hypothetical protein [Baekduia sp.]
MSAPVFEDAARFGPYDAGELVAASFACPLCLSLPSHVVMERALAFPSAVCWCSRCDGRFVVHLDEQQAMRLALAPPAELPRPVLT